MEKQLTKEECKKQISKKIQGGMRAKGLKKIDFAKLMNVQPSIITRWLKGDHNFELRTLF